MIERVVTATEKDVWKSPRDSWAGKAEIVGDIINAGTSSLWDVLGVDAGGT
jgi:hypothetical protein